MSCRRFFLFALTFLLSLVAGSRAVTVIEGPTVRQGDDGLVVSWKTDAPSGGKLRYGLVEEKLDQGIEDGVAAEHHLHLPALQAGAHYFFNVGTARKVLEKGSFDTSGSTTFLGNFKSPTKPAAANVQTSPARAAAPLPKPPAEAPPTRVTWGNLGSLPDHFARHGGDFSARSVDDYAAQAWRFRERATAQPLPMKQDTDGTVRAFDPKTFAFAAYNRDGTTKTYFRPNSASYWQRQPGRTITTAPWLSK